MTLICSVPPEAATAVTGVIKDPLIIKIDRINAMSLLFFMMILPSSAC
jgi:hypothetical protein